MASEKAPSGWAVVTGASSGIGRAFALELVQRGYSVLAVARRRERLDALAAEVPSRHGWIEPLVSDLKTEAGVAMVMKRANEIGEIELLINNAGVAAAGDFLATQPSEEIDAIRLNIETLVSLTRQILPAMVRRKRGAVINIASVVAFQPFPHFAVYAASKAFVLSFSEALAEELKATGVRVLALCPGAVSSEMDVFAHNEGLLGKLPSLTPEQVAKAGLGALERHRVTTVVGWLNRFLPLMDRVMPRRTVRWMMGIAAKPPRSRLAESVH